jgi:hypothetical protein
MGAGQSVLTFCLLVHYYLVLDGRGPVAIFGLVAGIRYAKRNQLEVAQDLPPKQ